MQPCEVEGRYAGFLTKMAVGLTSGGCLQLLVDATLRAEYNEEKDEFLVLQGPPQEISGRVILTKKNGDVNGYQYGVLKEALDWDGKDIADLQTKDFSKIKVVIWVVEDDYRNDGSFAIDFISTLDWTPGVSAATGKELEKIQAKWAATKCADESAGNSPPDEDSPWP